MNFKIYQTIKTSERNLREHLRMRTTSTMTGNANNAHSSQVVTLHLLIDHRFENLPFRPTTLLLCWLLLRIALAKSTRRTRKKWKRREKILRHQSGYFNQNFPEFYYLFGSLYIFYYFVCSNFRPLRCILVVH